MAIHSFSNGLKLISGNKWMIKFRNIWRVHRQRYTNGTKITHADIPADKTKLETR